MAKVKKYGMGGLGGVIPEMMGALGPKNKGFALGILPGLFQRDRYDRQQAEEQAKAAAAAAAEQEAAIRQAAAARQDQGMKKGGSVKGWGAARGARKAKVY
jgi:hypothetical protein